MTFSILGVVAAGLTIALAITEARGQLITPVSQTRFVSASGVIYTNNDPFAGTPTNASVSASNFGPWAASLSVGNSYSNNFAFSSATQTSAVFDCSMVATGNASFGESSYGLASGQSKFDVTFYISNAVTYTINCTLQHFGVCTCPTLTLTGPTGTVFQATPPT